MPSDASSPRLTTRDLEILRGLWYVPLTVSQLLRLSATFSSPFGTPHRLRARLLMLVRARWVRQWRYATATPGAAPTYFTLAPLGYRLLQGPKAPLPSASAFAPVAIARQHHTQCLADFIVHTAVAAHTAEVAFTGFYRENSLRLAVGSDCLFPDCAFQLAPPSGIAYSFFVELDNATESVRSKQDLNAWQRKLLLYDALQDQSAERFRVLIVTTARQDRLQHILTLANEVMHNPGRALFYGSTLPAYLETQAAVSSTCFFDHRGHSHALVSSGRSPIGPTARAATTALVRADPLW